MCRCDAAARQQDGAWRSGGSATAPQDTAAGVHIRGERDCPVKYVLVRVIAKRDIDTALVNVDLSNIAALRIGCRRRHTRFGSVGCRPASHIEGINYRCFCACRHVQRFGDLGADGVGLVGGYGDGRKYSDDRNDNHQLDQCETCAEFLHCCHHLTPHLRVLTGR